MAIKNMIKTIRVSSIIIAAFLLSCKNSNAQVAFTTGDIWKDTDGNVINAHGAGILQHEGTYYLYGEIKKGTTWLVSNQAWECYRVPAGGVSCYSSNDLLNWKYEGVALTAKTGYANHDLDTSNVIERPKVIYNKKTGKFVMWMHIDSKEYSYARSGVAISDKPIGPFTYINSVRPNGSMARDMTIYKDEDDKAYHFFSSEDNKTIHITLLTDDYLSHTNSEKRILIDQSREAPAVFKHKKKYYLITSACTGWLPNAASTVVADNIMGEWKQLGNPCMGDGADSTFQSQSSFVMPLPGNKNKFIFLADKWNKTDLQDSRYVWLPLIIKKGKPIIQWKNKWNVDF